MGELSSILGPELISLCLHSPQLREGLDGILEHRSLQCVLEAILFLHKRFMQPDLFLPVENESMEAATPLAISNPGAGDVSEQISGLDVRRRGFLVVVNQLLVSRLCIKCCLMLADN